MREQPDRLNECALRFANHNLLTKSQYLGLVYTSSYCRTKPNIVKIGNGTAERHFDLYVEPVQNSIDLIVIYSANIYAKFGGKFVKSNKMAPVHKQKLAELVLFKLIKRRQESVQVNCESYELLVTASCELCIFL